MLFQLGHGQTGGTPGFRSRPLPRLNVPPPQPPLRGGGALSGARRPGGRSAGVDARELPVARVRPPRPGRDGRGRVRPAASRRAQRQADLDGGEATGVRPSCATASTPTSSPSARATSMGRMATSTVRRCFSTPRPCARFRTACRSRRLRAGASSPRWSATARTGWPGTTTPSSTARWKLARTSPCPSWPAACRTRWWCGETQSRMPSGCCRT